MIGVLSTFHLGQLLQPAGNGVVFRGRSPLGFLSHQREWVDKVSWKMQSKNVDSLLYKITNVWFIFLNYRSRTQSKWGLHVVPARRATEQMSSSDNLADCLAAGVGRMAPSIGFNRVSSTEKARAARSRQQSTSECALRGSRNLLVTPAASQLVSGCHNCEVRHQHAAWHWHVIATRLFLHSARPIALETEKSYSYQSTFSTRAGSI